MGRTGMGRTGMGSSTAAREGGREQGRGEGRGGEGGAGDGGEGGEGEGWSEERGNERARCEARWGGQREGGKEGGRQGGRRKDVEHEEDEGEGEREQGRERQGGGRPARRLYFGGEVVRTSSRTWAIRLRTRMGNCDSGAGCGREANRGEHPGVCSGPTSLGNLNGVDHNGRTPGPALRRPSPVPLCRSKYGTCVKHLCGRMPAVARCLCPGVNSAGAGQRSRFPTSIAR